MEMKSGWRVLVPVLLAVGALGACSSEESAVDSAPSTSTSPPPATPAVEGDAAAPVTLRIGVNDDEGGVTTEVIDELVRHVDELSSGTVVIEPVFRAAGPPPVDDWDQVITRKIVNGELDMGLIPSAAWDTEGVTTMRALNAPLLVDSDELVAAVVTSELADELLAGLDDIGVTGLALLPEGMRHIFAFDEPLLAPTDFAGKTIRSPRSDTVNSLFEVLGANVVDVSSNEWAEAVADGTIAGAESSYLRAGSLPGGTQTATGNLTLFPKLNSVVVNRERFESLTDQQRTVLRDAAARTLDVVLARTVDDTEAAQGYCDAIGSVVLASDADVAAFTAAVGPVYEALEQDVTTKDLIEGIRELKAQMPPPASAAACARAAVEAAAVVSPLDGVWTTSFTRDELASSPLLYDRGEVNDQNWGDFTFTLDRGQFTMVQENPLDTYTMKGVFAVDIDTVTLDLDNGEQFAMRWAVDGDTITLKRDDTVGVSPTPFVLRPWTKQPIAHAATIPDGTYSRVATKALADEMGLDSEIVEPILGADSEIPISLEIAGGRWTLFFAEDGGVPQAGDFGTYSYDVHGNWVAVSDNTGSHGRHLTFSWVLDAGVLTLTPAPSGDEDPPTDDERLMMEGAYRQER